MPRYIDGFVFPIAEDRLDEYQAVASKVGDIYREHGAIDYLEFVGDDLHREGTLAFPEMTNASSDETIIFGWIVYESREARDLVNKQVESDPRMVDLVSPLMDPSNPIFVPERMAYGGFKPLVEGMN